MRRGKILASLLVSLVFFAFLFGCAKAPTKEMEAAEKALNDAKAKEAHIYAEETFKKAEDAFNKAKALVNEKKYKEAKALLEEAQKLAKQAEGEIEQGKAKMKEEAEKLFTDIKTALDETKKLVPELIKKKVLTKDEAQNLLGKWEVDLAQAKDSLNAGKIGEARNKAKALLDEVKSKTEGLKK